MYSIGATSVTDIRLWVSWSLGAGEVCERSSLHSLSLLEAKALGFSYNLDSVHPLPLSALGQQRPSVKYL